MTNHIDGILEIKKRMESEFLCIVESNIKELNYKHNKWQRENPEKQRACIKKYENSRKGKIAIIKRRATREKRVRKQCDQLPFIDLHNIRQFYVNCPEGMVVDHIIPLSKGGKHHISNFQYLPAHINLGKKIDFLKN